MKEVQGNLYFPKGIITVIFSIASCADVLVAHQAGVRDEPKDPLHRGLFLRL